MLSSTGCKMVDETGWSAVVPSTRWQIRCAVEVSARWPQSASSSRRGEAVGTSSLRPVPFAAISSVGQQLDTESSSCTGGESFSVIIEKLRSSLQLARYSSGNVIDFEIGEALRLICQLEDLGIDLYFEDEIDDVLRNLHRLWNSTEIHADPAKVDISATATAFYLLRSRGFNVSADVFAGIVKEKSHELDKEAMLRLHIAASVLFPNESVLVEMKRFTKDYLTRHLGTDHSDIPKSLAGEINQAIQFPWLKKIAIVENINFIKIFKNQKVPLMDSLLIPVATEKLRRWESTVDEEVQIISRWNEETKIPTLQFVRNVAELMCLITLTGMSAPKYRGARLAFARQGTLIYVMDDLFDEHARIEELRVFADAMRRWETSLPEHCAGETKIIYNAILSTTNAMAREASIVQGRDLLDYHKHMWRRAIESHLTEAEWAKSNYKPTLEEYLEVGIISVTIELILCLSAFYCGHILSDDILENPAYQRIYYNLGKIARLTNDVVSYKREKTKTGKVNSVGILLRENPGWTEDEASSKLLLIAEETVTEVTEQLLTHNDLVHRDVKGLFLFALRYTLLSYAEDVNHPIVQCLRGRPDDTLSFSKPILLELHRSLGTLGQS